MKHILVISRARAHHVEVMLDYLRAKLPTVTMEYISYEDLAISFIDGTMKIIVESAGKDFADYDMVYFKSSEIYDLTAACMQYATQHGVPYNDDALKVFSGMSKLYEYSVLSGCGVVVPDTMFMMPQRIVGAYDTYKRTLGVPFVLKDIHASRGDTNEVIRSKQDFDRVAQQAAASEDVIYLIGQAFVPNDGDFRILVFGGEPRVAILRRRKDDSTHLNNTSQGGTAQIVPIETLPAEVINASGDAAQFLRLDLAGVDMVQDNITKKWYCFEVNLNPQMTTGSFGQIKWDAFADYLMRKLGE